MKKFLMAAAALALMGNVAFAGPNAGGTILVHNANLTYVGGPGYSACGQGTPPASCEAANTRIDGSDNHYWVWKVYAAFAPCTAPRLKAFDFGVRYGTGVIILDHGACIGDLNNGAFEQPGAGWPGSGTGDAIVFQNAQTTTLVESYWFAGYSYYGAVDMFSLTAGPYGGSFSDDGAPPLLDQIAGYGSLGFNQPGSVVCPNAGAEGACCVGSTCTLTCEGACQGTFKGPGTLCDPNPCASATGACCFSDHTCLILSSADCAAQGGTYQGDNTVCSPNPCIPVPTKVETWGQIKHSYR
jgi:hypothetical protein